MKRLSILAAAIVAAAVSLRADVGFLDLPSSGEPVAILDGGKVAWIDAVSTNAAWTPTVKIVRESWQNVADITTTVFTNVSYTVVWTNAVGTYTNVVYGPPAPTRPANATSFTTNTTTRTTATTNWAVRLVAVETNSATAGTSYVAPKDKVMLSAPADSRSRTTIAIER